PLWSTPAKRYNSHPRGSKLYAIRVLMASRTNRITFARAFHQAGHVVTAHALSLQVVGISLDPHLTYAARLERQIEKLAGRRLPIDSDRHYRRTEKKAMTLLSGSQAQRLLADPSYRHFGSAKDRLLAIRLLQSIDNTTQQIEAHMRYLAISVEQLMTTNLL